MYHPFHHCKTIVLWLSLFIEGTGHLLILRFDKYNIKGSWKFIMKLWIHQIETSYTYMYILWASFLLDVCQIRILTKNLLFNDHGNVKVWAEHCVQRKYIFVSSIIKYYRAQDLCDAKPTLTHMSIKKLQDEGHVSIKWGLFIK